MNEHNFKLMKAYGVVANKKTAAKLAAALDSIAAHEVDIMQRKKIGGLGKTVEIDESLFVKRKVCGINVKHVDYECVGLYHMLQESYGFVVQPRTLNKPDMGARYGRSWECFKTNLPSGT